MLGGTAIVGRFTLGGMSITNNGTITTLLGRSGDYVRIGDAATTSVSLNSEDDLLVTGELEVKESAYFISGINKEVSSGGTGDVIWREGGGNEIIWRADAGRDQFVMSLGSGFGRQLILGGSNLWAKDFDHATTTNPTLFVQSNTDPDTANDEWISLTHDVTDAVINWGSGLLDLAGASMGSATVTHDDYFEIQIAGVTKKVMTGA